MDIESCVDSNFWRRTKTVTISKYKGINERDERD
jgi:hypothetical protein